MSGPIVAIDGPAGSGKTTVARALSAAAGVPFLSTGFLYRAVAIAAARDDLDAAVDDAALVAWLARHEFAAHPDGHGGFTVYLDGAALAEDELRAAAVAERASHLAARAPVRQRLLHVQRQAAAAAGAVVEGRDTGTVVFPSADLKVFIYADPRERARRRARELNLDPDDPAVRAEIEARDRRDRERAVAPLVVAPDAVEIDSTARSVGDIVRQLLELLDSAAD